MTRNGKGSVGRPRRLARLHGRVVNKARIAPEPAAYAQRSCAAVRAFLRTFKGSFAYDNGMGNRHRAETSEAVVTSTLHPPRRRYGWADGIGAAAVLECPEEATRGTCRAISQVLLHMDGYRVNQDLRSLNSSPVPHSEERTRT